jgi:hypothetical protein
MTLEKKLMGDALKMMIAQGLKSDSDIAQNFMAYYYETRVKPFVEISGEDFIKLVELDITHPESRKKFDTIHPDCPQFFLDAASYFVHQKP